MNNTVIIYGTGCERCCVLFERTQQVLTEMQLEVELRKVQDPAEISRAGVLRTPSLHFNGVELVSGSVPTMRELQRIIRHALEQDPHNTMSTPCACHHEKTMESSCCCKSPTSGGWFCRHGRKTLLWACLAIIAMAGMKMYNHSDRSSSAASPQNITEEQQQSRVELTYYHFGARCASCVRMEQWVKQLVEEQFSAELVSGKIDMGGKDCRPRDSRKARTHS